MKYQLWSDTEIEKIEDTIDYDDETMREIGDKIIEVIHNANHRHNTAMLQKDIDCLQEVNDVLRTKVVSDEERQYTGSCQR